MTLQISDEILGRKAAPREVAEAHHRIANSLAVIAGLVDMHERRLLAHRSTMDVSEVRLLLQEIKARIKTVSRLHRLLVDSGDGAPLDLGDYLSDIASSTVSCLTTPDRLALHFRLEPNCRVQPELALPIGLIVGELITNSIKYAHPTGVAGRVTVACHRGADGGLIIGVSDDGVGLPNDFDAQNGGHTGLHLIRSLARQLRAEFTMDCDSFGLQHTLRVPPPDISSLSF